MSRNKKLVKRQINIVIAGNYHEYTNFLKEHNFLPIDYRFCDIRHNLRGYRNVNIYLVGNYISKQREWEVEIAHALGDTGKIYFGADIIKEKAE